RPLRRASSLLRRSTILRRIPGFAGAARAPGTEPSMRTHYCGLVDESLVGQPVVLCGWVNSLRLQSHVAFVDLRDHEGIAQVVIERDNAAAFAIAGEIGNEFCLRVSGTLRKRLAPNDKLATGAVELLAETVEVLNAARNLPFALHENPNEEMRLKYRYLD